VLDEAALVQENDVVREAPRLAEIVRDEDDLDAPRVRPLDEVRDAVEQGWRAQAVVTALRDQAEPAIAALRAGAGFAAQGLTPTELDGITRRDYRADAPADFIETVFSMSEGEVRVIEGAGRIHILRLDAIAPPDEDDPDLARIADQLRNQIAGDMAQDVFQLLANDIRDRAGVTLDQAAINAVHANFN